MRKVGNTAPRVNRVNASLTYPLFLAIMKLKFLFVLLALTGTATVFAFSKARGPYAYNATESKVSASFSFGVGHQSTVSLSPHELFVFPNGWQVTDVFVTFENGRQFSVSPDDATKMRGSLDEPKSQVWAVDQGFMCVTASRAFKSSDNFRCPVTSEIIRGR